MSVLQQLDALKGPEWVGPSVDAAGAYVAQKRTGDSNECFCGMCRSEEISCQQDESAGMLWEPQINY